MQPKVEKIHWLPRIALAAFVIGAIAIAVGFIAASGIARWVETGAGFWLMAYFLILVDNFKRKIPVRPSMGGVIRHEERPVLYALVYAVPLVMGLFALFFLLGMVIFF